MGEADDEAAEDDDTKPVDDMDIDDAPGPSTDSGPGGGTSLAASLSADPSLADWFKVDKPRGGADGAESATASNTESETDPESEGDDVKQEDVDADGEWLDVGRPGTELDPEVTDGVVSVRLMARILAPTVCAGTFED